MDIDPQALLATRENAERNGVLDRVQVTADREVEQAEADVLLANILAGPLVDLAPAAGRPDPRRRPNRPERTAGRAGRCRDSRLPPVV